MEWLHDPSVISSFQHHFHDPPPTRVGPRKTFDLYHGKGCNISQLIATVKAARIRPDGRSRFEYADSAPKGLGADRFDLDGFEWSYDREYDS